MSDDQNLIKDHEYDGIQECDYPLPNWWLFTFLATIMFGYLYFIHYELGGGQSISQELEADLAAVEKIKKAHGPVGDSEDELQQLLGSGAALEEGKSVFAGKCAACHGPELQGSIGPNLTDEFWIHGQGKLVDVALVIRKGALDKGMPPWDGQLKDSEIKAVTVFIVSQIGSKPANTKA
ncbi:MAG TPA: cbb3-type cytochrome c oxidase N-terminal domain-containing protein, partial [Bdellovibrionales bacterium]|nr:cbb3-type cytochrome c oxidase N-terminal domain-containing protein [Bdellovibrionales bacterium]